MPKYKVFSSRDLIRLLQEQGFIEMRTRGSHTILQKKLPDSTITVPVPLHKEIKIGTLMSIIRQSRLEKGLFESE